MALEFDPTAEEIADSVGAPLKDVDNYWPLIRQALIDQKHTSTAEVIATIATVGTEVQGSFSPINEYGGNAYFFRNYEQNQANAKMLGNTQPGDGVKFHGRGFVQLTGRWNYDHYGKIFDLDLVNHPELALVPENAAGILPKFMADKGAYALAKKGKWTLSRARVNGGTNGLEQYLDCVKLLSKLAKKKKKPKPKPKPTLPPPTGDRSGTAYGGAAAWDSVGGFRGSLQVLVIDTYRSEFDNVDGRTEVNCTLNLARIAPYHWSGTINCKLDHSRSESDTIFTDTWTGAGDDSFSCGLAFTLDSGSWNISFERKINYTGTANVHPSTDGHLETFQYDGEFALTEAIADVFPTEPSSGFNISVNKMFNDDTDPNETLVSTYVMNLLAVDIEASRQGDPDNDVDQPVVAAAYSNRSDDTEYLEADASYSSPELEDDESALMPLASVYLMESESSHCVHLTDSCPALLEPYEIVDLKMPMHPLDAANESDLAPCKICLKMLLANVKQGLLLSAESSDRRMRIFENGIEIDNKGFMGLGENTQFIEAEQVGDTKTRQSGKWTILTVKHSTGKLEFQFSNPVEGKVALVALDRMRSLV